MYVAATGKPDKSSVEAPFDQRKLYGVEPPVTVISILPSEPPKHETSVCDVIDADNIEGSVINTESILTQPLASVTVTI